MKTLIHTLKSATAATLLLAVASGTMLLATSCERKPRTLGEKIDDALDTRPNEKLKDAAEDVGDAAKDAAHEVKDAVKDATR